MSEAAGPGGGPGGGGVLRKRSVTIAGHRTSLSLEAAFWDALKEIAAQRGLSLNRLIEDIDRARQEGHGAGTAPNLSSAARVFVLGHWRRAAP